MKSNPWAKLVGVSLVGIILALLLLWGVQQFTQFNYYNRTGTQIQINGNRRNMQMNINTNNNSNMMNNNSNMQGGMMDDDM